jgi:mannitol-specific phosphotransferase system IIBC component
MEGNERKRKMGRIITMLCAFVLGIAFTQPCSILMAADSEDSSSEDSREEDGEKEGKKAKKHKKEKHHKHKKKKKNDSKSD